MFRYGSLPLPRRRNYALDCALAHSHVCSAPSPVPSSFRQTGKRHTFNTLIRHKDSKKYTALDKNTLRKVRYRNIPYVTAGKNVGYLDYHINSIPQIFLFT